MPSIGRRCRLQGPDPAQTLHPGLGNGIGLTGRLLAWLGGDVAAWPTAGYNHPYYYAFATFREGRMRKSEDSGPWVVYPMTVWRKPGGMNAVCEQGEWDAMELAEPGYHTLIRGGITNEAEAELLARGTSGDAKVRPSR